MIITATVLDLFDGEGGAAAPAPAQAAEGAQTTTGGAPEAGGQDTAPDAGEQQPKSPEDLEKEFKALIKGQYKEQFGKEFQKAFDRRYGKEIRATQERMKGQQPIIDLLSTRYGVKDGDMDGLMKAIQGDKGMWESAAEEAGMPVDQYKAFQAMRAENQRLHEAQRESIARQIAQRQAAQWQADSAGMTDIYPGFDLQAELQNPAFKAMLRAGASVRNAYEACHIDEIKTRLVQETAKTTEKKVTDNIRAKGGRPAEAGGAPGVTVKFSVENSTKEQRAELARRAKAGEKIRFW